MRPRYEQRLSPEDVGSRVTVRRWVEDADRGLVPSDVVGRLVDWSDDDVLTIRKRDDREVTVEVSEILTSRVVPEHPVLPPERRDPPER